jgi:hypothetical protein
MDPAKLAKLQAQAAANRIGELFLLKMIYYVSTHKHG